MLDPKTFFKSMASSILMIASLTASADNINLKIDNQSYQPFHIIERDTLFKEKAFIAVQDQVTKNIQTAPTLIKIFLLNR